MKGYRYEVGDTGIFQSMMDSGAGRTSGYMYCNEFLRSTVGKGPCWFTEVGYQEFKEYIDNIIECYNANDEKVVLVEQEFEEGEYIPFDRHQFLGRPPKMGELIVYCEGDVREDKVQEYWPGVDITTP